MESACDATSLPPRRWVLDTNVWLDLLLFEDPQCARIADALDTGRVIALTDAHCHAEWCRVLTYPALRLSPAQLQSLQQRFSRMAVPMDQAAAAGTAALPRCRDRDDQKFLELAAATAAEFLITRDDALLELDPRTQRMGLFRICRPSKLPDL